MVVIKMGGKAIAYTSDQREFELTDDEYSYYKAVKRLEKYAKKQGRLQLFGNGSLSIRMDPGGIEEDVDTIRGIRCEGGDGGDKFDPLMIYR